MKPWHMDFACLKDGFGQVSSQFLSVEKDELFGMVMFSVLLAVPFAPVVLALYQRRVQKLMSLSTQSAAVSAAPSAPTEGTKPAAALGSAPTAESLLEAAEVRGRTLWKALALSVTVFSVGIALAITISPDSPGELSRRALWEWVLAPLGYLIFVGSLSAPMVLLGVASARFAGLFWKWFAPAYIAIVAVAMIFEEKMTHAERVVTFLQGLVLLAVIYAALGGRRMRNVVPLLSVLLCLLLLALVILGAATTVIGACTDKQSIVVPLLVSAFTIAGIWAAWRLVLAATDRLARAYKRKLFSDAQFQVGAWMVVITLLFAHAPGYTELGLNFWSLGVIPPLIGGLYVYRKLLRRVEPWKSPRALLLLRVFARDKRDERLLDEIAFRWRFIGPIHMIGGPDLAKTNLEPNELLLFLRRGLRQIFVTDRPSLQRRLTELDVAPDPDGRYRINESFCSDNVWRETVGELLGISDAILLDLRGFTAARRGTAFELRLLAERDALKRSVVLIDRDTDMSVIEKTIVHIPGAVMPQERVLRSDHTVEGNEIFRLLASGALLSNRVPIQPG